MEEIKEKVKNNKDIIMTGFVQGEELDELYSNCYLYCLPSDVEGMPISLLEALSYGKNCLVSDIEENIAVTEDYATSFKKGNVEDLAEKLQMCLKAKNRRNENEILNYVLNKYNWEDVIEDTLNLYKKIISSKG